MAVADEEQPAAQDDASEAAADAAPAEDEEAEEVDVEQEQPTQLDASPWARTCVGDRLEARDKRGAWYLARVVALRGLGARRQVKARDSFSEWYDGRVVDARGIGSHREVKVHFLGWNKRFDEWIACSSGRLRQIDDEDEGDEGAAFMLTGFTDDDRAALEATLRVAGGRIVDVAREQGAGLVIVESDSSDDFCAKWTPLLRAAGAEVRTDLPPQHHGARDHVSQRCLVLVEKDADEAAVRTRLERARAREVIAISQDWAKHCLLQQRVLPPTDFIFKPSSKR
ncbi:hypothetical protein Ctob_007265 [Chrysochromulina tobinii]|uniref:BRCT domain-containing protein n=1 Tax=Chrysochromulina tobinii TaxID=1460289 RepID=A0A0M0K683_9EUKA|nr:hypothetical protein Ctob_007265 [Chrysochromulina tobinii]|eukprot:KOO34325.1 hypothetical protein Ctob_007265 [Chrysochromulina sp. CCMP291]